jgi:hypothetical protein
LLRSRPHALMIASLFLAVLDRKKMAHFEPLN